MILRLYLQQITPNHQNSHTSNAKTFIKYRHITTRYYLETSSLFLHDILQIQS